MVVAAGAPYWDLRRLGRCGLRWWRVWRAAEGLDWVGALVAASLRDGATSGTRPPSVVMQDFAVAMCPAFPGREVNLVSRDDDVCELDARVVVCVCHARGS